MGPASPRICCSQGSAYADAQEGYGASQAIGVRPCAIGGRGHDIVAGDLTFERNVKKLEIGLQPCSSLWLIVWFARVRVPSGQNE